MCGVRENTFHEGLSLKCVLDLAQLREAEITEVRDLGRFWSPRYTDVFRGKDLAW